VGALNALLSETSGEMNQSRDRNNARRLFERLAHDFENVALKFGKLVEEPAMLWMRVVTMAFSSDLGGRMVGVASIVLPAPEGR
jgi:hypothetical protein